jgi:hypothetical protein
MLENGVIKTDKIVKDYKQMPNSTNGNRTGFGIFINHNQAVSFDLDADSFVPITHYPKAKTF